MPEQPRPLPPTAARVLIWLHWREQAGRWPQYRWNTATDFAFRTLLVRHLVQWPARTPTGHLTDAGRAEAQRLIATPAHAAYSERTRRDALNGAAHA